MQNFRQENRTQLFIDNGADDATADIVVVDQNGGPVGSGDDLIVKQGLPEGITQATEIIRNKDVKSVTKKEAITAIPKYATVTYTAGQLKYSATITVDGFGSISFENQAFVPGWYAGADGTSAAQVAVGIAENLRLNLSKYEPVPVASVFMPDAGFDFVFETVADVAGMVAGDFYYVMETNLVYKATGAAAGDVVVATETGVSLVISNPWFDVFSAGDELYVVEKPQAWAREKKPESKVLFNMVAVHYVDVDTVVSETVAHSGSVANPVSALSVCDLEAAQFSGFGDQYSSTTFPYNFDREYKGSPTAEYAVAYIITYGTKGTGINYGTDVQRQLYCVFASDPDTADSPAADFETAIVDAGLTIG